MSQNNDVLIGLEIHVQMTKLKTKLFCNCSSDYRRSSPNTNVCPVCLGLPGSLPVVNKEAVKKALQVALALKMKVANKVIWSRKHYFYPDLPKNYQITQYEGKGTTSIAVNGVLDYEYSNKRMKARIRRINIEEDPGKIVYPTGSMLTSKYVLVDYNRSGIALLEIVTEPDFHTPEQVSSFIKKLRTLLEHLDIADFDLEGSMRVDVNISVKGGSRTEVKNIGSISEIENAIRYEVLRQKNLVEKGLTNRMETRHWDPLRKVTVAVRIKETEEDYRYMPDPNLPPLIINEDYLDELRKSLPELPDARKKRYVKKYGLTDYLATVLVSDKKLADYFDIVIKGTCIDPYKAASYIVNDLLGWIPSEEPSLLWDKIPPETTIEVLELLREGKITIKMAKEMIPELIEGKKPSQIIKDRGWTETIREDEAILGIISEVFEENPKAVEDARRNKRAIQYLVGLVMKKTQGKADPRKTYELIVKKLIVKKLGEK